MTTAIAYYAAQEQFVEDVEVANLKARGLAIEEALRDEFIRPERANELLDELFDIDRRLEDLGEVDATLGF